MRPQTPAPQPVVFPPELKDDWLFQKLWREADPSLWTPPVPSEVIDRCGKLHHLLGIWIAILRLLVLYSPIRRRDFSMREIADLAHISHKRLGGDSGYIQQLIDRKLVRVTGSEHVAGLSRDKARLQYHIDLDNLLPASIASFHAWLKARQYAGALPQRAAHQNPLQENMFHLLGMDAPDMAMPEALTDAAGMQRVAADRLRVHPAGGMVSTLVDSSNPPMEMVSTLVDSSHPPMGMVQRRNGAEAGDGDSSHPPMGMVQGRNGAEAGDGDSSHPPMGMVQGRNGAEAGDGDSSHPPVGMVQGQNGAEAGDGDSSHPPVGMDTRGQPSTYGDVREKEREKERKRERESAAPPLSLDNLQFLIAEQIRTALQQLVMPHIITPTLPASTDEPIPAPPAGECLLDAGPLTFWTHHLDRTLTAKEVHMIQHLGREFDGPSGGFGPYWVARVMIVASFHAEDDGKDKKLSYLRAVLERLSHAGWSSNKLNTPESSRRADAGASAQKSVPPPHPRAASAPATQPTPRPAALPAPEALPEPASATPDPVGPIIPAALRIFATFAGPDRVLPPYREQQLVERVTNLTAWTATLTIWQQAGHQFTNTDALLDRYGKEVLAMQGAPQGSPKPSLRLADLLPRLPEADRAAIDQKYQKLMSADRSVYVAYIIEKYALEVAV